MASNVVLTFDKGAYVGGESITLAASGDYTHIEQSTGFVGPVQVPFVSSSGAKFTVTSGQVEVTIETEVHDDVVVDPSEPIVDTSATPRTWTISADGKSITAVA